MSLADDDVASRLMRIHGRIEAACRRSGRSADEIVLVGACKRQPTERLLAAWEAGLRVFGENHVQDAMARRSLVPDGAEWHLLGPLQSNKVKRAVDLFDVIHSLDRLKIAQRLESELASRNRSLRCFLEINLGGEMTKHGLEANGLARQVRPLADLEYVRTVGLMAIPPASADPEGARPWFRRLRELRDEMTGLPEWEGFAGLLSMGMSGDFEVAIEEGATHLRVGTVLFGPRPGPG